MQSVLQTLSIVIDAASLTGADGKKLIALVQNKQGDEDSDDDMDPEEFAAEMEGEKKKLRKEACRNYCLGAVGSFILYGIFWAVVSAQNSGK